ncbi:MAG: hypothetical protein MAGBODY4_01332 [Candidatus Marinimicrobia bacterium]|nr:hypothetical protein [Candidatus Neomarinimicrobiota bacterium]
MKKIYIFLVPFVCMVIGMTSPVYAVDPVEEADYLIITHPQLDNGGWLSDLTALQESRGYAVGVWYVNDQVTSNTDIQQLINDAYLSGIPVQYVLLAGMAANQTPETPLPENQKQETRDLKNPTANALELNFIPFTYENMEIWGGDVVDVPTDDHYYPSMHIQNNPIYIGRVPARKPNQQLCLRPLVPGFSRGMIFTGALILGNIWSIGL